MRGRPRFFSGMTKTQKILGWIFAPFIDEDGNPKEIKTQIEFKPEDF